jgi:hypothetical protein
MTVTASSGFEVDDPEVEPHIPAGYGMGLAMAMTPDVTPPLDPSAQVAPTPVVAPTVPAPTLVDGRPA